MAAKKRTLDELFAEDESGLLDVKPRLTGPIDESTRARSQYEEINAFFDRYGFAPGQGPAERKLSVSERSLQTRLRAFRSNDALRGLVTALDRHGLLAAPTCIPATRTRPADDSARTDSSSDSIVPSDTPASSVNALAKPKIAPRTLDDILDSDDDLLGGSIPDIFNLRHVRTSPARADRVSERAKCDDFAMFRPLFDKAAAELASGKRRSLRFANEQDIEAGGFFILNGVMVYVAEVRDPHVRNGKRNARLRLIFDNGTEGNNLLRSLATELYKDPNGRRISDPNPGPLFAAPDTQTVVLPTTKDRLTGLIYVVKSLSQRPEITRLDGQLFKIGFTSGSLETRIRAAADDPTFLMAPAKPVLTYDAINLNVNAFERILHHLFAEARLDIEVIDRFGKPVKPREWFLLPLSIIEEAVPRIVDGSILGYRYDHRACALVKAN